MPLGGCAFIANQHKVLSTNTCHIDLMMTEEKRTLRPAKVLMGGIQSWHQTPAISVGYPAHTQEVEYLDYQPRFQTGSKNISSKQSRCQSRGQRLVRRCFSSREDRRTFRLIQEAPHGSKTLYITKPIRSIKSI